MKYLELFSGTKSVCRSFDSKQWDTFTIDNQLSLNPDLCIDILELTSDDIINFFGKPDVIWASPPCTTFSVASIGSHWTGGVGAYIPKSEASFIAIELVKHTLNIINELQPTFWFIENPRGVLRKMPFMDNLPRYTVTYCQYGDLRMKPTDIWTNHPSPCFKPMCHNRDKCHEAAPRGSKTGTQGLKTAKERGIIPKELCDHIVNICEKYNSNLFENDL